MVPTTPRQGRARSLPVGEVVMLGRPRSCQTADLSRHIAAASFRSRLLRRLEADAFPKLDASKNLWRLTRRRDSLAFATIGGGDGAAGRWTPGKTLAFEGEI